MKRIVVGVDDSQVALRALERAWLEAQVSGWPLTVAHAFICRPDRDDEQEVLAWLDEVVDKAMAHSESDLPVSFTCAPVQGPAPVVLAELSRTAELLVVGGRDLGLLRSALVGSTTTQVLHHAHSPVMLVPDLPATAGLPHRVVVGVDGSPNSHEALLWAHAAAHRYHCPLIAVRATILPGDQAGAQFPELKKYDEQTALAFEHEVKAVLPEGSSFETRLSDEPPATALVDLAGESDLLVVGARGRGGFLGLLLGSVAHRCAEQTRGCLVVVPGDLRGLGR